MTQQIPHLQSKQAQAIEGAFRAQLEHYITVGKTSTSERRKKLRRMERWLLDHKQDIRDCLWADFAKPAFETDFGECYMVLAEIRHARRNLKRWMRDEPVRTPLVFTGTRSYIRRESKGCCLVIAPANYPVNLALGPVVSAIAAGNCVILKPSERTPHSSDLIRRMVTELFPPEEVTVIQGGVSETQDLLRLPFHHIFFTGSPQVGKIVMKAAAENLSSVTLELGGKSPVIVDGTSSLKKAARRIAWGKYMNAGQTCQAPDYVLVQREVYERFYNEVKQQIARFYNGESRDNPDFANVVAEGEAQRLRDWSDGQVDISGKYVQPSVLKDLPEDSMLLHEEVFGPVLPMIPYGSIEEAIAFIQERSRPLSMYIFSKDKRLTRRVLEETRSGSVGLGITIAQFAQNELPFGGVNGSGIGKAHGFYGFEAFSNQRSIMKATLPVNYHTLVAPPYSKLKQRLLDFVVRWL